MKDYLTKIKLYISAHKKTSIALLIIVLLFGFWIHGKLSSSTADIRYITAPVTTGTIISSVTETGQVSASTELDLKPQGSGNITYIGVQNGATVKAGTLIAELDTTDAEEAVQNAEASLESAQLALQKLQIQDSTENLSTASEDAYANGFTAVSSAFVDLPTVINGLGNILTESIFSDNAARQVSRLDDRNTAETSYNVALNSFNKNQTDYSAINSNSGPTAIENIITETNTTTTEVATAVKDMLDFVNGMANSSTQSASSFTATLNTLSGYTNTINTDVSSLTTAQTNITNSADSSQNDSIDLQSAQLNVTQQQNALQDAKDNLADYYVRAPFDGTVTGLTAVVGDAASSGTAIATLITNQQLAEVTMNEVDVAKIQVGDKATLTFDAIPNLSISGTVAEIDSIGTVSQGVVSYNVEINFDTQDPRVKPSMSVSAAIITGVAQDVLVVPNGAIKTQGGTSYVQMFSTPLPPPTDGLVGTISKIPPNNVPVQIGLANNVDTQILSGINAGDEIVTRTITSTTTSATTTTAPSLLGSTGGGARGGFGGGGGRAAIP